MAYDQLTITVNFLRVHIGRLWFGTPASKQTSRIDMLQLYVFGGGLSLLIYLSIFSLISHYYTTLWSLYCCFVVLTMSLVVHLYHSSCSISLILHFSLCRVIFNMHCFAWISILTILLIWSSLFFSTRGCWNRFMALWSFKRTVLRGYIIIWPVYWFVHQFFFQPEVVGIALWHYRGGKLWYCYRRHL